ncbi:MAG: hypothetical protein HOQ05_02910 [Corynebacteriales bacterium]|nr:hypothetical protein [Mycobacteriales bacterium]
MTRDGHGKFHAYVQVDQDLERITVSDVDGKARTALISLPPHPKRLDLERGLSIALAGTLGYFIGVESFPAKDPEKGKRYPISPTYPSALYSKSPTGTISLSPDGFALTVEGAMLEHQIGKYTTSHIQRKRWIARLHTVVDLLGKTDELVQLAAAATPETLRLAPYRGRFSRWTPAHARRIPGRVSGLDVLKIRGLLALPNVPGIFGSNQGQALRYGPAAAGDLVTYATAGYAVETTAGWRAADDAPARLRQRVQWRALISGSLLPRLVAVAGRFAGGSSASDTQMGMSAKFENAFWQEVLARHSVNALALFASEVRMSPHLASNAELGSRTMEVMRRGEPAELVAQWHQDATALLSQWNKVIAADQRVSATGKWPPGFWPKFDPLHSAIEEHYEARIAVRSALEAAGLERSFMASTLGQVDVLTRLKKRVLALGLGSGLGASLAALTPYPELGLLGLSGFMLNVVGNLWSGQLAAGEQEEQAIREQANAQLLQGYADSLLELVREGTQKWNDNKDASIDSSCLSPPQLDSRPRLAPYIKAAGVYTLPTTTAGWVSTLPASIQPLAFGIITSSFLSGPSVAAQFYLKRKFLELRGAEGQKLAAEIVKRRSDLPNWKSFHNSLNLLSRNMSIIATQIECEATLPIELAEDPFLQSCWKAICEKRLQSLRTYFQSIAREHEHDASRIKEYLRNNVPNFDECDPKLLPSRVSDTLQENFESQHAIVLAVAESIAENMDEHLPRNRKWDTIAPLQDYGTVDRREYLDLRTANNTYYVQLARALLQAHIPEDNSYRLISVAFEAAYNAALALSPSSKNWKVIENFVALLPHAAHKVRHSLARLQLGHDLLEDSPTPRPRTPRAALEEFQQALRQPSDIDAPLIDAPDGKRRERYLFRLFTQLIREHSKIRIDTAPLRIKHTLDVDELRSILQNHATHIRFGDPHMALTQAALADPEARGGEEQLAALYRRVETLLSDPAAQLSLKHRADGSVAIRMSRSAYNWAKPDPTIDACVLSLRESTENGERIASIALEGFATGVAKPSVYRRGSRALIASHTFWRQARNSIKQRQPTR